MLNLWQKNGVFKIEIIQPLLDMAAGTSNAAPGAENVTNNEGTVTEAPASALPLPAFCLCVCLCGPVPVCFLLSYHIFLYCSLAACLFSKGVDSDEREGGRITCQHLTKASKQTEE